MTAPSNYRTLVAVDPDGVRDRRFVARLSEFDVADACGVESSVIRRLERGADQSYYTLGFVDDLAKLLGCHITDLLLDPEDRRGTHDLPEPATPTEGHDRAAAGALLAGITEPVGVSTLADALRWPLVRTLAALELLEQSLPLVGQCLVWISDSHVKVIAAIPDEHAADVLAAGEIADSGLTIGDANAFAKIRRNASGAATATGFAPGVIDKLRRAGIISTDPGDDYSAGAPITLTEQAKYDLFLE